MSSLTPAARSRYLLEQDATAIASSTVSSTVSATMPTRVAALLPAAVSQAWACVTYHMIPAMDT